MKDELSLRRSLLYVPGNMPSMLQNVPLFLCDAVFVDLEDAVPLNEKDAARILVSRFVASYVDRNKEVFVRINALDTPWGHDDLRQVLPSRPDGIRLPKADTPEIVERLDTLLTEMEEELGVAIGTFKVIPSIESALGVINAIKIARCSSRVIALAFGAEDYTASMEIERTKGGEELFHARARVLWAAKAAGIQAIDTIFADVGDMDSFRHEVQLIKNLGFTGKSLVNPRQIAVVHEVFAPKQGEIDYALQVIEAIIRAREMGTGVISLDGKMVDAPVVKRAARMIKTAVSQGLLEYELDDEVIYGAH
ncbi:CoA ester lyase [Desulfuromonas acetoxidans]|uniref:Citryl-CoA lyase n=1 Tax=Desulfuromonas acetoxidans (strain DSM 684 / 11070) TaxID=281689 RepID=Q1JZB5_DESA6|nr:aldolase/citrate lyase family protein [Desulfuromonas acetoxidans]EAT15652.1 Citryl-CoA lyase [Desulfuromonas acetoxidans DSM 684]MBF0646611.1 HpcH/HpaI aldolase/citrate lyase family protein [Desulfuromonas acetoxidans]NVD25375.1 HpcH/HpaI aldolase/citrate lyase family protein [Desulfuromonas acetoxidans]NVE17427.1 HpcH/HpaI aldolase/citrate lyase family protein [Desulfuromonas acetoxidans]